MLLLLLLLLLLWLLSILKSKPKNQLQTDSTLKLFLHYFVIVEIGSSINLKVNKSKVIRNISTIQNLMQ